MPAKKHLSILHFTRKDRRGSLFLLLIVLVLCMGPYLYFLFSGADITEENKFDEQLAALKTKQAEKNNNKFNRRTEDQYQPYDHPASSNYTSYASKTKGNLFYFDPNTLSTDGWKKLGLRDKTIATIVNFRNKGGKFRQPEDLKKIWGLFPDEAERLIPYVQIATGSPAEESYKTNYAAHGPQKMLSDVLKRMVDVNNSDTAGFISLPGIGAKLSQRIINFRNKLGGFYDIEQVKETFGLPDSVFQKIKPMLLVSGDVNKININTATLDELKAHPYIKYHLANAIVQYRTQHGDYKTVEDIKKIMIVDEQGYAKMYRYLKTE